MHAAATCRCVTGVVVSNGTVPVDIRVSQVAQTSSQHWGMQCLSQLLVYMAVMAASLFEGLQANSLGHMLCCTGNPDHGLLARPPKQAALCPSLSAA